MLQEQLMQALHKADPSNNDNLFELGQAEFWVGYVAWERGDLQNAHAVQAACAGMDAVFHIAAKAGAWGDWDAYYGVNVTGTANIITGCRRHHVPKLVNCSSPSVTHCFQLQMLDI